MPGSVPYPQANDMTRHWQPDDHILLREISRGQIWSGRPYTVVEDTPCRLLLYAGAGVRWMKPSRPDGANLRMREPTWILKEDVWNSEALRIVTPGSRHSVSIARTYRPVVARVIEPPCGPVDGLLSPLGLRVNHLLSVEQGPVG